MRIFILLLIPFWLFASQILSYNVYDRSDRVDIMLTFDTPFEGTLRQLRQNDTVIIKLDGAQIESVKQKSLSSPFLSSITLSPSDSGTQIIAKTPLHVQMQASKTADAYGLRLRFLSASSNSQASSDQPTLNSTLPTKKESAMEDNYIIVALILIVGIVIVWWLKRGMQQGVATGTKPSLFAKNSPTSTSQGATIRFQKALDAHNSVVMLEYAESSYLVIIGNNNIVLDKFYGDKPVTQNDFETMLKKNEAQLETYLQLDTPREEGLFESYKEKASG
ncbi:MAG: hypothetical protein JXK05_03430 [Campylobacterales bacterium]|nr:hypothetical protein [Campylobacterales bacterium]